MKKRIKHRPGRKGRNELCYCGSELKYKKCCLLKKTLSEPIFDKVPEEVLAAHNKSLAERHFLESQGIYIGFPNTIIFKGKSYLAVGNKLLWIPQPDLSFHQLIIWNLTMTLGTEWWDSETAKPADKRHFIRYCLDEIKANPPGDAEEFKQVTEKLQSFVATGNMQSIISLAFDVYILTHKGFMPGEWMRRLSDRNEYQGVRYEIAIASIFVRMGATLEFYSTEKPKRRRAEFIAHHTETDVHVAVEAKSRQRPGIIHAAGEPDLRRAMRGDVQQLFNKALLKETDELPFLIFIDINAPTNIGKKTIETRWFDDVQMMFDAYDTPTANKPQKHNALITTNYSFHYDGNSVTHAGQFSFAYGIHPKYPLKDGINGIFFTKLMQAVSGYGYVPANFSGIGSYSA